MNAKYPFQDPLIMKEHQVSPVANSPTLHHITNDERGNFMGACTCGYSTDPEKNCNGTHKVVQAVKADIAEALEANGFPHASEFVKTNKIPPKN